VAPAARGDIPVASRIQASERTSQKLDEFVQTYERELPAVVQCFPDDFDACIAHLRFALRHRRVVRTTNLLERLKLMYAAVIRAAERWQGIAVGKFEQRQLRTIRDELGRAHAARVAPAVAAKATAAVRKIRVDR
jgi:hypothetical protein